MKQEFKNWDKYCKILLFSCVKIQYCCKLMFGHNARFWWNFKNKKFENRNFEFKNNKKYRKFMKILLLFYFYGAIIYLCYVALLTRKQNPCCFKMRTAPVRHFFANVCFVRFNLPTVQSMHCAFSNQKSSWMCFG